MKFRLVEEIDNNSKIDVLLYNGTDDDFDEINISKLNTHDYGYLGKGFYLSESKKIAREYGNIIKKFRINVKNPFCYNNISESNKKELTNIIVNKYYETKILNYDDANDTFKYWIKHFGDEDNQILTYFLKRINRNTVTKDDFRTVIELILNNPQYIFTGGLYDFSECLTPFIKSKGFDCCYISNGVIEYSEVVIYDPKNLIFIEGNLSRSEVDSLEEQKKRKKKPKAALSPFCYLDNKPAGIDKFNELTDIGTNNNSGSESQGEMISESKKYDGIKKYNVYNYNGPIKVQDKKGIVQNIFGLGAIETTASSIEEAKRNIIYQIKKRTNQPIGSDIIIDETKIKRLKSIKLNRNKENTNIITKTPDHKKEEIDDEDICFSVGDRYVYVTKNGYYKISGINREFVSEEEAIDYLKNIEGD